MCAGSLNWVSIQPLRYYGNSATVHLRAYDDGISDIFDSSSDRKRSNKTTLTIIDGLHLLGALSSSCRGEISLRRNRSHDAFLSGCHMTVMMLLKI